MGCLFAAMFALLAFVIAAMGLYRAAVNASDLERMVAKMDHPSGRRRPLPPEDRPEWGDDL